MLLSSILKIPCKNFFFNFENKLFLNRFFVKRHKSHSFLKFDQNNKNIEKNFKDFKTIKEKEITVYKGQLTPNIRRIKIFSLTTTFIGLVCYPFMFDKASKSKTSGLAYVFVGWTLIMVIFSPLALNLVTKRYITKLTFDKNNKVFTATTLNFFNQQIETKFTQSDVNVPAIPDPAYIEDIPSYQHLLGYDKPLKVNFKNKPDS